MPAFHGPLAALHEEALVLLWLLVAHLPVPQPFQDLPFPVSPGFSRTAFLLLGHRGRGGDEGAVAAVVAEVVDEAVGGGGGAGGGGGEAAASVIHMGAVATVVVAVFLLQTKERRYR